MTDSYKQEAFLLIIQIPEFGVDLNSCSFLRRTEPGKQ
jgi:hypothetical protein